MSDFFLGSSIFYFAIFLVVVFFIFLYQHTSSKVSRKLYMLTTFLVLFVPVSIRYNVGADFGLYEDIFNVLARGYDYPMEIGYVFINKLVCFLQLPFQVVVVIVAFVTLLFSFILLFKQYDSNALIESFILLICLFYFLTYNGMRQCMAVPVASLGVYYLSIGNARKFLLYCLLGATFHTSVLVLLPFYYVRNLKFEGKLYGCIVLVYFVLQTLFMPTAYIMSNLPEWFPYNYYVGSQFDSQMDVNTGLGIFINVIIGIIIMFKSKDVIDKYPKSKLWFFLYFIFVIIQLLSYEVWIFTRLRYVFLFAPIVIIPLFVRSIKDLALSQILALSIYAFYIATLFITITRIPDERNILPYETFIDTPALHNMWNH